MEAAKYELRVFNQVMRLMDREKRRDPEKIVNVVELNDNFYLSGPNGVHMCFVYERLGGSLLDLIKHYKYQGIPLEIVRPLAADVCLFHSSLECIGCGLSLDAFGSRLSTFL